MDVYIDTISNESKKGETKVKVLNDINPAIYRLPKSPLLSLAKKTIKSKLVKSAKPSYNEFIEETKRKEYENWKSAIKFALYKLHSYTMRC